MLNGWKPSNAATFLSYDVEGRVYESNISRSSVGRGASNSLYATEAERFDSVAPFLRMNIINDRSRRNYFIQPGGAALFKEQDEAPEIPGDGIYNGHEYKVI